MKTLSATAVGPTGRPQANLAASWAAAARGPSPAPSRAARGGLGVVIVTGIFPPDAGGPATHAADLAAELTRRGHCVIVVTLGDGRRSEVAAGLVRLPRSWSVARRSFAASAWLWANRSRYDVIYATGLHEVAAVGGLLAGRPVVAKVVGDQVWERSSRLGRCSSSIDEFLTAPPGDLRIRAMATLRSASLRSAHTLIAPSVELS